jgi:hypothetical protein
MHTTPLPLMRHSEAPSKERKGEEEEDLSTLKDGLKPVLVGGRRFDAPILLHRLQQPVVMLQQHPPVLESTHRARGGEFVRIFKIIILNSENK